MELVFQIIVLIFSVIVHEVAHGASALYFGDQTAKNLGRLTLNPIKHLDLFGSIILPFFLIISGTGFVVGWAKPVPYNPYNLRNRRVGEFCVAIAGIVTNLFLAVVFGLVLRFSSSFGLSLAAEEIISYIVIINLVLAVFNLMPIPPLDGSKIILALSPLRSEKLLMNLERYGVFVLILFRFANLFITQN